MKNEENTVNILETAIKEISNINYKIDEFNKTIYKLSENLNIIMDIDKQEDIAIAAKDVNEALINMNERYKEFLKENNITENLNNSLEMIKNSLSTLNRKVNSIENKKILKENTVDNLSKKINMHTTNELEKFKSEIIKNIRDECKDIFSKENENTAKDIIIQNEDYGQAFLKDNSIYYISKINGSRIHQYDLNSRSEAVAVISSIVNGQKISIKPPKSVKISYEFLNKEESYLIGIAEKDRSLYAINFNTAEYSKIARYCIDFKYLDGHIYALVHNNIVKIKINPIEKEYMILLENEEISESKGSLGIVDNKVFINFNEYSFLLDVKTSKLINIL